MADKRNYEWPDASTYNGYITQDKSGGITERVSVTQVENRLVADGFAKTDQMPNASSSSPADLAISAVTGASNDFARADHAHKKPSTSDIGAEPALGDPGAGNWFLKTVAGIRSWINSIPWASVDKTGAVASDVGAWPEVSIGGAIDFHNIYGGLTCIAKINGTSYANSPYLGTQLVGYGGLLTQSRAANGSLKLVWLDGRTSVIYTCGYGVGIGWGPWVMVWDEYSLPAGTAGKNVLAASTQSAARSAISALPVANPTATGTLTAPDVVASSLAGTGIRACSLDASGKLVSVAKPDYFHGSWTSGTSILTDITDWADPLVDEAHYKCFVAGKLTSSTATETRFRFIIGGVSTSTVVVYSKGDWSVSFDVTTIGGSGASVCAVISSYGSFITKHFELSSLSYVSAGGIRLQIASDDDNAQIHGLCTRLERLQ